MAESSAKRITCTACGKALRWREDLVGKRMKCTCGAMFVMPAAPGVPEGLASPVAGPDDPFKHDAFELEFPGAEPHHSSPPTGGTCPSCRAPMKSGAVLCVRCGFHTVTGSKLSTGTHADADAEHRPRPRSERALLDEEQDYRFTEVYLPVAMIIVGVIVTIIRAYTGMGELSMDDEEAPPAHLSPFFGEPDPGPFEDMEEEPWNEEGQEQTLDDAAKTKQAAENDGGEDAKSDPDAALPSDEGTQTPEVDVAPPPNPVAPQPAARAPPAPGADDEAFNVSPLIVAGASLLFQLLVMVPFVFVCVLFVAKYVDVTFGSLSSVLLKLTAVVLGPMAIADWIDDILLQATMGFGFVLAWTIRLVLVGSALIKLFDLDFFEAMILMIVVAFVRFILAMLLVYALVSMFVT